MKIITVCNLKGGTGKTTTAAHLAHAFAQAGSRVVIIDADPQQQMLRWSEQAEWDIPVIGQATATLHKSLKGVLGTDRYDVCVIDTPPISGERGIAQSALYAADTILIPMAPTMAEYERLPDVWDAIDKASLTKDPEPAVSVLFTRTVANASSTGIYRNLLTEDGHRVVEAVVPRREAIAQSFGSPITDLYGHDLIAQELGEENIVRS